MAGKTDILNLCDERRKEGTSHKRAAGAKKYRAINQEIQKQSSQKKRQVLDQDAINTTEQIFNLRILCERYLQYQQDLSHAFTDLIYLKRRLTEFVIKPFGLLLDFRLYNINANLIHRVIENLYNMATSAVYLNGGIGDWFTTTVGVRQGRLLSPSFWRRL